MGVPLLPLFAAHVCTTLVSVTEFGLAVPEQLSAQSPPTFRALILVPQSAIVMVKLADMKQFFFRMHT